ncbi:MAG: glycosyltransferase [Agarilytica sp.]
MRNNDLVVFGEDWGGLPSSTQHIIKHLAADRKILWVNSIGLRSPKFSVTDITRAFKKITQFISNAAPNSVSPGSVELSNVNVIYPLSIPAPKSNIARYISAKLLKYQLLPHIKRHRLHKPILWSSLPTTADMIGHLDMSSSVYYCGDDFSSLAGVDHETIKAHEQSIIEKSDLIICASKRLARRFPQNKTKELLHGVDYDLFSTPVHAGQDFPIRKRPTAGFYGSISDWIDLDLLQEVIQKLPSWNFIFIGRVKVNVDRISAFKNVYFLGEKNHKDLPRYSQHWDVSLLPFRKNKQIEYCNPLKLLEYMAAGKPIVSTLFPAANYYRGIVQCANTSEEFVTAITCSRHAASLPFFSSSMRSHIGENTWQAKTKSVSKWLGNL